MADPVTIGLGVMAAGGIVSAASGYQSDMAQAGAERENADYFRKQAAYSQAATDRELDIFQNEVDDLMGRQLSGYGKAGVSMSGSPLLLMGQTQDRADAELAAIKEKGRQNVELTLMRAQQADNNADSMQKNAPWKAFGSLLGTAGSMFSRTPTATTPGTTSTTTTVKSAGNIPTNTAPIPTEVN